MKDCGLL
jgi:hypothetical protein